MILTLTWLLKIKELLFEEWHKNLLNMVYDLRLLIISVQVVTSFLTCWIWEYGLVFYKDMSIGKICLSYARKIETFNK